LTVSGSRDWRGCNEFDIGHRLDQSFIDKQLGAAPMPMRFAAMLWSETRAKIEKGKNCDFINRLSRFSG